MNQPPFWTEQQDVSALRCVGCGEGLVGSPEVLASVDPQGIATYFHPEHAPRMLRIAHLWAESRLKAQWN